ncbi:PC4/YdbC family ssDNA-binding protein [Neobacillus niacini]|uniref:PC4/YdbC family ssDNA-binding protein n=1 Tax=Neobacillus niacini TaxID=86668 RepID=UPI003002DD74
MTHKLKQAAMYVYVLDYTELNLRLNNGREPIFDIQEWDQNRVKMGKGVTLSKEEMEKLKEVLGSGVIKYLISFSGVIKL